MPTKGRFTKGTRGFVRRAKALFTNQSFPPAALVALKKGKFFNRGTLEMLTMCSPDFLKLALKELGERKISVEAFKGMVRENAYLTPPSRKEKSWLKRCSWVKLVDSIEDIMRVKKIRLTMFEGIVLGMMRKYLDGTRFQAQAATRVSTLFSNLRSMEAKYFTFRQVLAQQERKELWRGILEIERQIFDTLNKTRRNLPSPD
ncbi:MAG: hypothetical protein Q7K34_04380 [archaeon]|nr:hypothetical protein [archaeon]